MPFAQQRGCTTPDESRSAADPGSGRRLRAAGLALAWTGPARPGAVPLQYEPSPKHKPLPSPGRRGATCPSEADGAALLAVSVVHGQKRYATDGVQAFCAQCHDVARDLWHGYPISWSEVPPSVRRAWSDETPELRRAIRRGGRR